MKNVACNTYYIQRRILMCGGPCAQSQQDVWKSHTHTEAESINV